jgi:hypothetical protein
LLFRYFDQQPTTSIEQGRLTAISVAFTFVFKSCVVIAVLTSFDQQMWFTFRQKPLKGSHIERIFSAPTSIFSLLHLHILRVAPITWGFAALCWLIPIAAIFPPGSIRIEGHLLTSNAQRFVPTFNSSRPTVSKIVELNGTTWDYSGPAQVLKLSTTLTVLGHGIRQFPSPCGTNCSYTLSFQGPTFQCRNSTVDSMNPLFAARDRQVWINTNIIDNDFWIWYTYNTFNASRELSNIDPIVQAVTCCTYEANYTADFLFLNDVLSVENITFKLGDPLNWTEAKTSPLGIYSDRRNWIASNFAAISQSVISLLNGNVSYTRKFLCDFSNCRRNRASIGGWADIHDWYDRHRNPQ